MGSFFAFFIGGFIFFFIFKLISSSKLAPKGRNSQYIRTKANYTTPRDKYGNFYDPYTGARHKRKSMDADHIWPYSKGGPNADWNIIYTHKSVNRSKGNKISPYYISKGFFKNKAMRKNIKTSTKFGASVGIGSEILKHIDHNNIHDLM